MFSKSAVREKIRETLTETNPQLPITLLNIQNKYTNARSDIYTAKGASGAYFNKLVGQQIFARATRDYYDLMLVGLVFIIAVLLCLPQIQKIVLRLRKETIPY